MSSNIYEKPHSTVKVRYAKDVSRDGRDREERLVDIYESADAVTDCRVDLSTQDGGTSTLTLEHDCEAQTQMHRLTVQRNLFIAAALILGLLLVAGASVLSGLYLSAMFEKHEFIESNKEVQIKYDNHYCELQEGENSIHGNLTRWTRRQCSCYYKSTEKGSWEDGRSDCRSRGADLVIIKSREEQDFLRELDEPGDSWIGLESNSAWEMKWKWVDGSTATYQGWKKGVNVLPTVDGLRGYIEVDGVWNHSKHGSKQWICEKQTEY